MQLPPRRPQALMQEAQCQGGVCDSGRRRQVDRLTGTGLFAASKRIRTARAASSTIHRSETLDSLCRAVSLPEPCLLDWAWRQNNLGNALRDEGERADGDKARALLSGAVHAYEYVLEVYTRASLPQNWAMTMRRLARAHKDLGDNASAHAELKAAQDVSPQ